MPDATSTRLEHTADRLRLKRLRKAFPDFYQENRNLLGTRDAFRKRLERRHVNGLVAAGAVVETALGLMIDPHRFRIWLLEPARRVRSHQDGVAA